MLIGLAMAAAIGQRPSCQMLTSDPPKLVCDGKRVDYTPNVMQPITNQGGYALAIPYDPTTPCTVAALERGHMICVMGSPEVVNKEVRRANLSVDGAEALRRFKQGRR